MIGSLERLDEVEARERHVRSDGATVAWEAARVRRRMRSRAHS